MSKNKYKSQTLENEKETVITDNSSSYSTGKDFNSNKNFHYTVNDTPVSLFESLWQKSLLRHYLEQ